MKVSEWDKASSRRRGNMRPTPRLREALPSAPHPLLSASTVAAVAAVTFRTASSVLQSKSRKSIQEGARSRRWAGNPYVRHPNGEGVNTETRELLIEHGALYPALQRLEDKGLIRAGWGVSKNNRKARFYKLTLKGRTRLDRERTRWNRMTAAIGRVLDAWEIKA